MNSTEYKKYHESFMQNNHGSSEFLTFFCIFFTVQCATYISIKSRYSLLCQYVYEYIIMILPMILAHTILSKYIYGLNFIVFIILFFHLLCHYHNVPKKFAQKNIFRNDRIPLVSCLRGLTYLITVFCILAVDFQDFPRYLAKTERFGYSLMDTGVGLFVAVSGLVHKDLRKDSLKNIIKGNVKIISILLVLGVGRFVSVKQLNYQEHITEYGVHWNFFFTLAICKIISTIVLYLSNHVLFLCIASLILHEFILYIGLQHWVFGDTVRDTLISANREGISSCLGYVSIYLFAVSLKNVLLNKSVSKYETLWQLIYGSGILCILTYFVNLIRPASRTLANAGYCLYIDAILITITSVLYYVTVLYEEQDIYFNVPQTLLHINTNGLSYFLISNLLTGAINLTINTLLVSSSVTFIILNIYMIVTLAIIVYLYKLGFKI